MAAAAGAGGGVIHACPRASIAEDHGDANSSRAARPLGQNPSREIRVRVPVGVM